MILECRTRKYLDDTVGWIAYLDRECGYPESPDIIGQGKTKPEALIDARFNPMKYAAQAQYLGECVLQEQKEDIHAQTPTT